METYYPDEKTRREFAENIIKTAGLGLFEGQNFIGYLERQNNLRASGFWRDKVIGRIKNDGGFRFGLVESIKKNYNNPETAFKYITDQMKPN